MHLKMCLLCLVAKYWYLKSHHYYSLLPGTLLKNQTIYSWTWQYKCVFALSLLPHTREQEHLGGKNNAGPKQLPARHLG